MKTTIPFCSFYHLKISRLCLSSASDRWSLFCFICLRYIGCYFTSYLFIYYINFKNIPKIIRQTKIISFVYKINLHQISDVNVFRFCCCCWVRVEAKKVLLICWELTFPLRKMRANVHTRVSAWSHLITLSETKHQTPTISQLNTAQHTRP